MISIKYLISRLLNRRPSSIKASKIDKTAKIGNGAQIVESSVGRYTYIYGSDVICAEVGAFCSIAEGCIIGGGRHPTDWVSTSPAFYRGKNVLKKNYSDNVFEEYKKTEIGNDVWIGSNCLIKGGVAIGDGAIIGMGSVVTKDIPPYEIWAGNPAHIIRKRFDDETINKLLKIKWWDFDEENLKTAGDLFNSPDKLIKYSEEHGK